MRESVSMSARWTPEEDKTLLENVVEGVEVSILMELLPNRSIHAITSRAKSHLGYGVKHGRFNKNVSEDIETADEADITGNNITPTESLEGTTKLQSSEIISDEALKPISIGLKANSIVIRMLTTEHLEVNAKIVYKLSTYIEELLL